MLAFLYQGLKLWKKDDKTTTTIDGFVWLIMGFFFYHFKDLYEIFGIAQEQQPEMPLLASLIKALAKVGANHHWKINNKLYEKLVLVDELLAPPKEGAALPITWHPYHPSLLPSHLVDQIRHRTIVAPMFCYNYVEYHFPHIVAKQFESLQEIDLSGVGSSLHPIVHKANKGRFELNFKNHYENNIREWVDATPIGLEEDASSARREEDASSARREEDASSSPSAEEAFLSDQGGSVPEIHERGFFPETEEGGSYLRHDELEDVPRKKKKQKRTGLTTPVTIVEGKRYNRGIHNGRFSHPSSHAQQMPWKQNQVILVVVVDGAGCSRL